MKYLGVGGAERGDGQRFTGGHQQRHDHVVQAAVSRRLLRRRPDTLQQTLVEDLERLATRVRQSDRERQREITQRQL